MPPSRKFDAAIEKATKAERYAKLPSEATLPPDWEDITERIVEEELTKMRKTMPSGELDFEGFGAKLKTRNIPSWVLALAFTVVAGGAAAGLYMGLRKVFE